MEVPISPTPRRRVRLFGWAAITSVVVLILLIGATTGASALAAVTSLHQATPIAYNNPSYQGGADECAGTAPGTVDWHFVLVQTTASSGMLQATFATAGTITVSSDKHAGGTLHWDVITGPDTLEGAFTDQAGKLLNLSHICVGPPVSTTSSSTSSTSSSTSSTSSSTSSTSSSTSSTSISSSSTSST